MLAGREEIIYSFEKARSAFRDITYPTWRQALINKASEIDVRSYVIQVLRHLPDQEYLILPTMRLEH